METDEIKKTRKRDMFVPIIITQAICITLLLLTVLAVKFFFEGTYKEVKEWYGENVLIDTDINEVLSEGGENEV